MTTRNALRFIGLLVVLALAAPVPASVAATGDGLTVYSGGMALVRTRVEQVLEAGQTTVRIDGLPSGFDPASLVILDPAVELLGTHGLRAYQDGGRRGVSLAMDLESAGTVRGFDIAYLTGGFDWSASYTLVVDPDDRAARVAGYASVANQSGTDVDDAEFQLLAGEIARGGRAAMYDAMEMRAEAQRAMVADPAPSLAEQGFAGYHLYTFEEPLSLATGETRRVRLFPQARAAVTRELRVVGDVNTWDRAVDPQRVPVAVRYRVERPAGSPVGDTPLPHGQVHVLQPDGAGRAQLLGIAAIGDSPAGQELVLPVGTAFDVTAERLQTSFTRVSRDVRTSAWQIELSNASDREVTVEVVERIPGDWKLLSSSHEPTATSARAARFELDVPAGGTVVLTYEVQVEG